jgi:catechol 2,3-dioxygenase-like lactoylglutathione lyase family enzyme
MIAIEKLRYVRLGVADLRKTADFATRIVGLQQVKSADGTATFRSDYRDHTLELYQNNVPEQTVAVELSIDEEHHRIAVHPSASDRLLEVQFRLEGMHELMQNSYFLQSAQVVIAHGPGRRPTSQQAFLSFRGPDPILFGFVADGDKLPRDQDRLPRQFPRDPGSFCAWGSLSREPEFCGELSRARNLEMGGS